MKRQSVNSFLTKDIAELALEIHLLSLACDVLFAYEAFSCSSESQLPIRPFAIPMENKALVMRLKSNLT